jgi:trehalose synthase
VESVDIRAQPLEVLAGLLEPERSELLMRTADRARELLAGRIVWNINSTASGGGVAEMLQTLLAYTRGAQVDTRWLVLDGDPRFFEITKAVHNSLHGSLPGRSGFVAADREHYQRVMAANAAQLRGVIRAGDIVLLHDPQTAGLAEPLSRLGAQVVWRCHIGRDETNEITDLGWDFLHEHLTCAHRFVFSRASYVPAWLPPERVRVIQPSIDPFSTKNDALNQAEVRQVLLEVGLVHDGAGADHVHFQRRAGSRGVLLPRAGLLSNVPPHEDAPLVLQVSRWDRLKDMPGVLAGFVEHVAPHRPDAHLILAGPDVSGVSDDPEGTQVWGECRAAWESLPDRVRARCHLASLPMDDVDANALMVNALQRHATVVVQKSLEEGFGLTLTEAMWKGRAVVASGVGGLQDQVTEGVDGFLVKDPSDLATFGSIVTRLLADPELCAAMGSRARERVRRDFLGDRHLTQWVELFADLKS